MDNEKTLDISLETIIKISLTVLIFYLLYQVRDILTLIVFALVFSVLFNPAINFLEKLRFPRILAIILIYILAFGVIGLIIYLTAPLFVGEVQRFSAILPHYFELIAPPFKGLGIEAFKNFESFINNFETWLVKASANILGAISVIFGGILSALTVFVLSIFFSLEKKGIEKTINILSPKKHETYILSIWKSCQNKVSLWFGTRILASLFVGVMTYLALYLFKMEYSFILALIAGITNIIPFVGPLITALLIFILAALDSWLKALFVLIAFIIIQQIENTFITPFLTKKFIGLPPILVLVSLMIGIKLWGLLGAVLTIPLVGVIFEFLKDYLKKRREEEAVLQEES